MASSERQADLETLHTEIRHCNDCGLATRATHYVVGEGPPDAAVMCVGEAPGAREDRDGRPFVGPSGRLLTRLLSMAGLLREEVFITSLVKCRPPGNRDPLPHEVTACKEHLTAQIAIIRPRVICTLGRFAGRALVRQDLSVAREHGRPERIGRALYVPLYHPAAALHQQQLGQVLEGDMARLRELLRAELGGGTP